MFKNIDILCGIELSRKNNMELSILAHICNNHVIISNNIYSFLIFIIVVLRLLNYNQIITILQ